MSDLVGDYINDYSEYVKFLTDNGYIADDGAPLRCQFCESTNMMSTYHWDYDIGIVVETEVFCRECNIKLGHWAYGHWSV